VLASGETLQRGQQIATKTTKPYECTSDQITIDEVERIVLLAHL
jgi:hypothetical protein